MKKILIIALVLPFISLAQTIKGTFSPAEDYTYAFLYKATPEGANYIDRGKLDSNGQFEIKLKDSLEAGIYKIVYAIPPEENNFDFIYDGKESVNFNFNQDEGVEFTESEENKLWMSYLKSIEMVNHTISNYYTKNNEDKKGFSAIFKTLKDTQLAYEDLAKDKLALNFITANRPYMPAQYENISTYSKNLKEHYLSQVDFSNYLLQSSTFLTDRVTSYVFNMVQNPTNDTYKSHIDDVAKAISNDDLIIKTSLLEMLWQHFVSSENHEVANYITDNYLLELAKATNNKVLEEMVTSFKNTSIGAVAPNFEITSNGQNTSLHQLKGSDYYLLVFWSSACGHCLDELPKVKDMVANKPNLKVVAFGLEKEDNHWDKEIKNYPNFIHQIGLGKWENPTVITYGVSATPMYFLLSADKIIMAKPYELKDLEVILKNL
ncbi:TlpA family protein disulfide reductase [Winogradskyella endarachnes]|uniref:Redoxin domain-containing protein n=1 Tax=Winogradskyella endarachnes TaxID=2681965 RepID=A0A6L6UAM8_9FLAO|nr:thioredoxin-like domain-containing protein [Winogradskyella endarachnes]MUU79405.1 redoxin domain-containing protein [Winogradskyella endarachnes]